MSALPKTFCWAIFVGSLFKHGLHFLEADKTGLIVSSKLEILVWVMLAGTKFVNVCGSQKADRSSSREATFAWVWSPAKSPGQRLKRGAEAAMTAAPSIADVQQAGFGALAKKLLRSVAV